jgi:uncharacterized membrane protein YbhN (UPF0104 family)
VAEAGSPENPESSPNKRRPLLRWGKFAFQAAILCLVAWGLWSTVSRAQVDLLEKNFSWRNLDYQPLTLAGLFYLLGILPCSFFWHRVMYSLDQRVPLVDAVNAFFISQLAKYVPGKVMVLVVRTALVRHYGVSRTLTVASIFVETLTFMSVGAMFGAFLLACFVVADWWLIAFAVIAAAAVGAPTLPPVFLRVVKLTKLHRLHPEIDQSLAKLNWHILWPGWLAITLGWVAMGLSLWAVLTAMPGIDNPPRLFQDLPLLIGCMALSTVFGFVSGLPGGVGARELAAIELLKPHFGETTAIVSAIVHRCVMLAAEFFAVGFMFVISKMKRIDK